MGWRRQKCTHNFDGEICKTSTCKKRKKENDMKMDKETVWGTEVDGTGSSKCPMVGFGISGVETSDSDTTVLVS